MLVFIKGPQSGRLVAAKRRMVVIKRVLIVLKALVVVVSLVKGLFSISMTVAKIIMIGRCQRRC